MNRNSPFPSTRPATLSTVRWYKVVSLLGWLAVAFLGLAAGAGAQEFRVLYTFSATDSNGHNSDGAASMAPLLLGMDGNFYGTTSKGGANGNGTIFQLTPTGALTTLYNFSGVDSNGYNSDGANSVAGLIQDGNGNFYGTAQNGGPGADGTVFELTANGQFITLYSFSGGDGANPDGALIFDRNNDFTGDLYGTTSQGGTSGAGTIFTIVYDPQDGGDFYSLYSLNGASDGKNPAAALLQASDGNFYGTAENGGANGYGTLFKFTYNGTFTTLASFGTSGNPTAPLIQGNDGNFYFPVAGMSNNANAAIYQYVPASGQLNRGTYFVSGYYLEGGLIQGSDGNFFGGAAVAANSPYGSPFGYVYSFNPGDFSDTFQVRYVFSAEDGNGHNSDGANVACSLIEGYDGSFYGTTFQGGANGNGTIFQLDLPPLLTSPTNATVLQGQPFSYQITAADSPTSYGVTGLSDGLKFNYKTGLISGTPTTAGTLNLTVSAANDAGAASQGLTVTVNPAPPAITSAKTASGTLGSAFSYQITATYSPTSYAASNLPPGLSVNTSTGLISGKPTQAGTYQTTVAASNAGGIGQATVTVTIVGPPTITSFSPTSGAAGSTVVIKGTNFVAPLSVIFAGNAAAVHSFNATQINAQVPDGAITGPIKVNTNAGSVSTASSFTDTTPPAISSFSPTSGKVGSTVIIKGMGFQAPLSVVFAGNKAAVHSMTPTQINAQVPSGALTGAIKVNTNYGSVSTGTFTVTP